MIKNRDFIIFSDDWGRHPFSCQHLMEQFLPNNRLLWVNTIGMRTPEFTLYDMKRALGKISSWLKPQTQTKDNLPIHQNLRIISPFMIPYNMYKPVRDFNAKSVIKSVLQAAEDWNLSNPILLSTQPLSADYAGKLKEEIAVYYCVDDFVNWPGMNQPKLVQSLEDSLLEKSDLVFAVSDSLCKSRTNGKQETMLLTHGVNISHFSRAATKQECPKELVGISHPIIGFYGLIDQRFDVELVQEILIKKPEWNFVCVGNATIDLDNLKRFANFHWIPAVSYDDLPLYASHFDIACIPYVINEHTHTINPLKLREYIATEKPIVATAMREAYRFEKVIYIAQNTSEFIKALEDALQKPIDKELQVQSLLGESWTDKAELVSSWLETTIHNKGKNIEVKNG